MNEKLITAGIILSVTNVIGFFLTEGHIIPAIIIIWLIYSLKYEKKANNDQNYLQVYFHYAIVLFN